MYILEDLTQDRYSLEDLTEDKYKPQMPCLTQVQLF